MTTTNILDLQNEEYIENNINEENESEIKEYIFDMENPENKRLEMLNKYYSLYGEEVLEIVNRMNGMFLFSGTNLLKNFLAKICLESELNFYLKLESAKCMATIIQDDFGYDVLFNVIKSIMKNDKIEISITSLIDSIFFLAKCENFFKKSYILMSDVINKQDLDCLFRYKTILSIENIIDNIAGNSNIYTSILNMISIPLMQKL